MSDLDRLKWQCRRGSLELDLLMTRYLNNYYSNASDVHKRAFEQLVEYPDTQLYALFMGRITAVDPYIADVVEQICHDA